MNYTRQVSAVVLTGVVAAPWVVVSRAQEPRAVYLTGAASALVDQGLARSAPTGTAAKAFEIVPAPGVRFVPTVARATNVPWIDSNGWRFQRGLRKVHYETLPPGSASLAAAEAFAFDVEAILNPDPADVDSLGRMLKFLSGHSRPPLPALSNLDVVDSPSPLMGEVLNMLTRRNLLYRLVSKPTREAAVTVRLGTKEFPEAAAANPHEFALRVRDKVGDENRLIRLYGTNTVIARLTGDDERARLILLSYGANRRPPGENRQAFQVRVLGRYTPRLFAGHEAVAGATISDLRHPDGATEFWVPEFAVCAIIDLERVH